MRRLLKWLAAALALLLIGAAILLVLATDAQPLVERSEAISPLAVAQARRLLATHDPRRQQSGQISTVDVPASLIDEGANYLAGRYLRGRGRFTLTGEGGEFRITLPLPGQRFLNLRAGIPPAGGMPGIGEARLGNLPLPGWLIDYVIAGAVRFSGFDSEWQIATRAIRSVAFDRAHQTVAVTYEWQPLILERARAVALSPDEISQLHNARLALVALFAHRAPGAPVSLAEILQATLPKSSDPRGEGRATLLVLASQLAGMDLAALVPAARGWPRPRWVRIHLAGRHDLAQHFVVSAALAAWSGEPVADAIGLYKELNDARHGSGFSFIDLAADRAGTRFGDLLAKRPEILIERLAGGLRDSDLLPPVHDLPEALHAEQFRQRFSSPDSLPFKALARDIESRLDTLPLYR